MWRGSLQRANLDFSEFDDTTRPLEGNRATLEAGIIHFHRFHAVQYQRQAGTFGGDVVGVPFAPGFGHRVGGFGNFDDRACAIGWVRALVEDIGFVAVFIRDRVRLLATQDYVWHIRLG